MRVVGGALGKLLHREGQSLEFESDADGVRCRESPVVGFDGLDGTERCRGEAVSCGDWYWGQ